MTLNLTNPNALVRKPDEENRTPCHGREHLFLSPAETAHEQARKFCIGDQATDTPPCPFIDWCKSERAATIEAHGIRSLEGTWAGIRYTGRKERPRGACGTPAGYTSHKYRNEVACAPCKKAESAAVCARRKKRQDRKAAEEAA